MGISEVIKLLGGVALLLYGMKLMGNSLENFAGSKLKAILTNLTSNPIKGFFLGLGVTAVVQSSAATIVMAVGFVNSGIMTLAQASGIIFGANLGTSATGWLISASGLKNSDIVYYALLFVGVALYWFVNKEKAKHFGLVLVGFSILMIGMQTMSSAVAGLKTSDFFEKFSSLLSNPILGILFGIVFTIIIQSSSASVGVLQSFAVATALPFSLCIPFIMGSNIGKTSTTLISCFGASKDAKRTAFFDLIYNVLSILILFPIFIVLSYVLKLPFFTQEASAFTIAITHTTIKIIQIVIMFPCVKLIVKITKLIVPDEKNAEDKTELLDDRLLVTPSVALEHAKRVTAAMSELAIETLKLSGEVLFNYSDKAFEIIKKNEDKTDMYEDKIGTYLVKLSNRSLSEKEMLETNQLLKLIGDYERIADHAMNIAGSGAEMHEKKVSFTGPAKAEVTVMLSAISEILEMSHKAYVENDINEALLVEPLEEVVDSLKEIIKNKHIERLQKGECTIEMGFVLVDLLTDLERVSDHCSNIACYVIESKKNDLDVHDYLNNLKKDDAFFTEKYNFYKEKYRVE